MSKPDRSIKEFLAEAEDILETANQALLAIENAREKGASDPDRVNALFRAVHSFKGLAGMFGLKEPAELSHRLEFLLDELRLGKVGLGRDAIDILVETVALLGRLVHQAGGKQPFENIHAALERIDGLIARKPSAPSDRPLSELVGLDRGILQVLTEYEEHRLRECIRERKNLYMLRAEFDLSGFEAGIKDLNALLKEHGEIICTLPTPGSGAGIGFSIVLASKENLQAVQAAITVPNVGIETIAYVEAQKTGESRPGAEAVTLKSASSTVRVDIYKLDNLMNAVGEMHLIKNIVGRIARELRTMQGFQGLSVDLHKAQRGLERKLNDLQEGILEVRMVPIGQIFTRLSQVVRMYAKEAGKEIYLQLRGEETELDKLMIEDLADPLLHLVRNAIDHGIETPEERKRLGKPERGSVRLTAYPRGNHVVITIEDDGAGMDAAGIAAKAVEKGILAPDHGLDATTDRREILDLIFLPGFTTRETVTEISGRGVGMDVVKRNVSKLSGIIKALIAESGDRTFAIPLSSVLEIQHATSGQVETVEGREVMAVREDTVPLLRVSDVFHLTQQRERDAFYVILVGLAERRVGVIVDNLRDQQEIVIKPLGKRLADVPGIAGATELGDRRGVVLVLDVESLIEGAMKKTAIKA